jgi:hypothetical protein
MESPGSVGLRDDQASKIDREATGKFPQQIFRGERPATGKFPAANPGESRNYVKRPFCHRRRLPGPSVGFPKTDLKIEGVLFC